MGEDLRQRAEQWMKPDLDNAQSWRWQSWLCLLLGAVLGIAASYTLQLWQPGWSIWALLLSAVITAIAAALALEFLMLRPLLNVLLQRKQLAARWQAAAERQGQNLQPDDDVMAEAGDPQLQNHAEMLEALVEDNQRLMEAGAVDRRRALQLESRLRAMMEVTGDTLLLTDAAGTIKSITDSAATVLRVSQSHAVGSAFEDIVRLYEAEKKPMREYPLRGLIRRAVDSQSSIPVMTPARLDDDAEGQAIIVSIVGIRSDNQVIGTVVRLVTSEAREFANTGSAFSHKDANTDLLTREVFERRVDELIDIAGKQECHHVLVMLALDGLSEISSSLGLGAADETLWQTARILQDEVGAQGDCYRIGSDHFAVLLAFSELEPVDLVMRRVRDRIDSTEFHWREQTFSATVSAALSRIDAETSGRAEVMEQVSEALVRARSMGGNSVVLAGRDESEEPQRRQDKDWIEWLLPRLEDERTHLTSQLAVPIRPGDDRPQIIELYLRIEDDDGTWLTPGSFMPAIVRHNLSARVDQLVFDRLMQVLDGQAGVAEHAGAIYSLNLSAQAVQSAEFREHVAAALQGKSALAERLCFEVDEMVAASHVSAMQAFVETMGEVGVRCALDRCRSVVPPGALRSLPLYMVKIHESLTRRMLDDRIDGAVLQWIAQANQMLGRATVAMGVETEECLRAVEKLGMDYAQGVHVNKMGPLVL